MVLSDLGSAKLASPGERNIKKPTVRESAVNVCTPLDMLFGMARFGADLDIGSLGCVAAELFIREPLFQPKKGDNTELAVLDAQFKVFGTPEKDTSLFAWMKSLALFKRSKAKMVLPPRPLQ